MNLLSLPIGILSANVGLSSKSLSRSSLTLRAQCAALLCGFMWLRTVSGSQTHKNSWQVSQAMKIQINICGNWVCFLWQYPSSGTANVCVRVFLLAPSAAPGCCCSRKSDKGGFTLRSEVTVEMRMRRDEKISLRASEGTFSFGLLHTIKVFQQK